MAFEDKLLKICLEIGTSNTIATKPGGEIIVVGCGIKSANQLTLAALSELKSADEVYYFINEAVTEVFIRQICPNACDLRPLYEKGKDPFCSNIQISEVCLHQARKGLSVCLVLCGHPSVNSVQIPRISRIAKSEGLPCLVLPGPSLVNCLFSDLCLDPTTPSNQQFDAIDFLEQNRKICTDCNVVFWNLHHLTTNEHLQMFVDKLLAIYGCDIEVVLYTASVYPLFPPKISAVFLNSIINDANFTENTLLYITPKTSKTTDFEMVIRLRFSHGNTPGQFTESSKRNKDDYGDYENNVIKELENWSAPKSFCYPRSNELSELLTSLSLNTAMTRKIDTKDIPILETVRDKSEPFDADRLRTELERLNQGSGSKEIHFLRKRAKKNVYKKRVKKKELHIQLADSESEYDEEPVENNDSESEEEIQGPMSQHLKRKKEEALTGETKES